MEILGSQREVEAACSSWEEGRREGFGQPRKRLMEALFLPFIMLLLLLLKRGMKMAPSLRSISYLRDLGTGGTAPRLPRLTMENLGARGQSENKRPRGTPSKIQTLIIRPQAERSYTIFTRSHGKHRLERLPAAMRSHTYLRLCFQALLHS